MKRGIRVWKAYAREMLSGNYTLPVLGTLAVSGINFLGSNLSAVLFPENSVLGIVLGQIFTFIFTLIMSIFSAGLSYMFLNIARGRAYSFRDLTFLFRNHPDRVITAAFVLTVIDLIAAIPSSYYSYTSEMGTTVEEQAAWAATYLLLFAVTMLLSVLLTLPLILSYYLLADNLEMSGMEALKKSAAMMKGYKCKYLLLQLSFLPWMILSVFTLYIGLLWLLPYMEMAAVMMYRDLNGEFDPIVPEYSWTDNVSARGATDNPPADDDPTGGKTIYPPGDDVASWADGDPTGDRTIYPPVDDVASRADDDPTGDRTIYPPGDDFNSEA